MLHRYSVVTPAYNEGHFLPGLIESMVRQLILPVEWVIVDDNSTDQTPDLVKEASTRYPFIKFKKITRDKTRRLGANVVRVVNQGLAALSEPVDFWVKLDADIILPEYYFAFLLKEFHHDPELGMASGKTYFQDRGNWILERAPDFHVVGPCQMFRRTCFEHIGGLMEVLGWDFLDVAKARSLGWKTRSYPCLVLYHRRQMGKAMGMAKTFFSWGKGGYTTRSHPLFVIGRSFYRALERPYFAALMMIPGFIAAWLHHEPRIDDPELVRFLRTEQLSRLMGKKLDQETLRVTFLKKAISR